MNTVNDNTSSPKTKNHPDENRTCQTGPWSKEEDEHLLALIRIMGNKHWKAIDEKYGRRDGKQCRERWVTHLDTNCKYSTIKNQKIFFTLIVIIVNLEPFTEKEDQYILQFYEKHGSKCLNK
ncbi:7854_t:CDS:2 [Ambispora gerdemannii]|uniref:7854_t:CDS:1 n=1 Tax=Ambispora gerdemannii TaxID=144530 RepID=A0A9N9BEL2_9GLOM|nr:7854_t:CDS:2 [Ambispora gerdemannii]